MLVLQAMAKFFISYNKADNDWAEWIAFLVEEAGHNAVLQAWDFGPGSNFVLQMQRTAETSDRTIMVLSPDYLRSDFAAPEWAAAFRSDPQGLKQKLLPIMVKECEPQGVLSSIVYLPVHNLPEDKVRSAILNALEQKRGKPAVAPVFPGTLTRQEPSFPRAAAAARIQQNGGIALPKIMTKPTDLQKRTFVRQSFETIKELFQANADAATRREPRLHFDIDLRTSAEFRVQLFVDGNLKNGCRISIGGLHQENAIGYGEGRYLSDGSFNEHLTVTENHELFFSATMASFMRGSTPLDVKRLTAEQAGEYLWGRFVGSQ
ncbi:toll/interleukin-1 receptor domain-containing protein [Rhizobium ruizarguesonis]|uniref:Toll/interleukin-1 receptor domain-containing protein n=1 Tax=Rhizobium ruizarguesonis TaxID=2081791 RepID=A0ABY1X7W0_9HYPH|nr:toll/interleukin-1 receptor domain-containing protein [Rhizobium ruizarguesonis]TAX81296.1 toll/interleukin-1 receptor domain-containing protein [Rhizobium ruizarguesonis]TBE22956.1 toll/interleukin-1 receptor domain-containing protein [Rhizobium ruizarguesonis]